MWGFDKGDRGFLPEPGRSPLLYLYYYINSSMCQHIENIFLNKIFATNDVGAYSCTPLPLYSNPI
ncbi:hypothetical protein JYQ62_24795 [Nostoc sp. UHCC 0702]|nr:hypothetical protein JYQ62_24795 [Nostoc sp. UHCC 0702]